MADEPTKRSYDELGYDPIEEDDLLEEPLSASHVDLPDPSDVTGGDEGPELRERREAARRRKRRREAELDRGLEGDFEPSTGGDKAQ
ncbi:MAG: hypothetical protein GY856_22950 [bacterium]|nr:hypothetical protein [bacterium]